MGSSDLGICLFASTGNRLLTPLDISVSPKRGTHTHAYTRNAKILEHQHNGIILSHIEAYGITNGRNRCRKRKFYRHFEWNPFSKQTSLCSSSLLPSPISLLFSIFFPIASLCLPFISDIIQIKIFIHIDCCGCCYVLRILFISVAWSVCVWMRGCGCVCVCVCLFEKKRIIISMGI